MKKDCKVKKKKNVCGRRCIYIYLLLWRSFSGNNESVIVHYKLTWYIIYVCRNKTRKVFMWKFDTLIFCRRLLNDYDVLLGTRLQITNVYLIVLHCSHNYYLCDDYNKTFSEEKKKKRFYFFKKTFIEQ